MSQGADSPIASTSGIVPAEETMLSHVAQHQHSHEGPTPDTTVISPSGQWLFPHPARSSSLPITLSAWRPLNVLLAFFR
jgi:hypothetical protein